MMTRAARAVYRARVTSSLATKFFARRELTWAALAVACAVVTYYACQTPEPASTALELAATVCDAAPNQRRRMIERHVAPQLEVDTSERGAETFTREELSRVLGELAAVWGRRGRSCQLELHDWRIESSSGGATWLEATLEMSDSQPSDLHARRRRVRALFRQWSAPPGDDVVQRLERLSVGPPLRAEPEARP